MHNKQPENYNHLNENFQDDLIVNIINTSEDKIHMYGGSWTPTSMLSQNHDFKRHSTYD